MDSNPVEALKFQAYQQLLKLLFTAMIKPNLISLTAVHVYDFFHMQFPSTSNKAISPDLLHSAGYDNYTIIVLLSIMKVNDLEKCMLTCINFCQKVK